MNSTLLKKYETIDQSKVSEKDKKVLEQVKKLTNGFEETDEAKNKVAEKILDQIATLNPDAVKKPQVVAQKVAKVQKVAKAKKVTKAKAPATTSTAKGSSNNIMSVAKEIQKAGESWKDAMERAKDVLKQRREQVVEQKKTELEKLLALVRTKKELQGFSKSDIQRDAVRTAKVSGARFVTKEGFTSNQYKKNVPNKLGRKYWETRDRHADRLAPNYPKDMPLLASGGAVSDAPFSVEVFKTKLRFDNELTSSSKGDFPTFAKAKEYAIDKIDEGNYYAYIMNNSGNLWGVSSNGVESFANGGSVGKKHLVGEFNEQQLRKGEDKIAIEKAKKETGLTYIQSKVIKKSGKPFMQVYLVSNEDYYNSNEFANGGMFEEPIGIMREVKGKTVNVPVTDEISQSEINRFVDYVYEAYESYEQDGVYEFTKPQVRQAVKKYLAQLQFENTWGGGDSLDRERVYEFLKNPNLKEIKNPRFAKGGGVFSSNDLWHKPSNSYLTIDNKSGVVKNVKEFNGNGKKEINIDGDVYRKNTNYGTYNSIKDNTVLTKQIVEKNFSFANGGGIDGGMNNPTMQNVSFAKGGGIGSKKYRAGQKFYDTRYDRVCEIVPSNYDGMVSWKRYNKSGTEFENETQQSLVENQFDYLVNMGAYQLSKQSMANGGSVNMNKHIWEGWTVGSFIEELEPQFNQIMSGGSWQKPFKTKEEVKAWCMDNQPYYKKNIPEVVNYFWAKVQSKDENGYYADGGSLPYMTDPNFGDFQNTGSFANGGSIGDITEQEFLKKYFGVNVFTENPSQYFEIKKLSSSDDAKVSAFVKGLKADGFTVKKRAYSDFTSVMGVKKKGSFELGGAFVTTDLAGHTGGTDGLGNQMPLSGVSGTYYTGLVGETGAMSSGELFMDGGAMAQNQQVINDASQSYVNYYLGEGAGQGIYKDGGSIPNNYAGRTPEDVWNNWTISQKKHFLKDHLVLSGAIEDHRASLYRYDELPKDLLSKIEPKLTEHIREGQYASGGSLGKALYVEWSSYFTYNKYDEEKMMSVLEKIGAKNIRLENDRGWSNQPEVVVFNGDKNKAQDALNEAFDTDYIRVREKDWRTKKMADGGFTPDVSDGTQFMSGVYANGGGVGSSFNDSVADKMEKISTMKSFASKVRNMKTPITYKELNDLLPDYVSGKDINDVLKKNSYADGGFTPNVSDGTQFMSGVYANGGGIGEEQEYLVVLQHSETGDLMNFNVLGNNEENAIDNAYMEADLNQPYEVYSVKKYADGGDTGKGFVKAYYNESISGGDNGHQVDIMFYENSDDDDYFDEEFVTTDSPEEAEKMADKINNDGYEGFLPKNSYADGGFTPNVSDGTQFMSGVYADGGAINGMLNKKIQKLADVRGYEIGDWATSEYNKIMTQALVESLTDANYHEEAKEVVLKAERKTKWSDNLYKSEYFNPDEKVSSFAREVARECDYTGDDIINAYFFLTKMAGSKVATMIEDLFLKPKTTKSTSSSKPTKYIDHNDIESVTLNVNGNFITFAGKDFLNGANLMEKGGDLSKIATYFPIRDIVKVTLKNGDTVNPLNGYWLKKGSEPMGKKSTTPAPKIDETKAHFEKDKNGTVFVDSNFVNKSKGNLPNSELKHYGFGEFYLETPDGNIEFIRTSEEKKGFVGRTHKLSGSKELIEKLINSMSEKGRFETKKSMVKKDSNKLVAPKGYVFVNSGSHRATQQINRGDAKYISLYSFGVANTSAGTTIMFMTENDYEKIKGIRGVSPAKNSLPAKSQWFSRQEDKKLDTVFREIEQKESFADGGFMNNVYADGGGIRSQEELNKIISEKDEKVKGLTPKQVAEMWNENSWGVKQGVSKPITVEEAKSPTMKMYLRNLLIENELTEDEYSEYFANGGAMQGNNIDAELEDFDLDNLDPFETMQYNQFVKSSGKVGALQILINTVEGDYSQLSPELAELAEMQVSQEQWDEASRDIRFERDGYADGGMTGSDYANSPQYKALRDKHDKLHYDVKSKVVIAVGLDSAIDFYDADLTIAPYRFIERAVTGNFISLNEINQRLIDSAMEEAEEIDNDEDLEEIGSSDFTYYLKNVLDGAGFKVGFVGSRLERLNEDGSIKQINNGFFEDGGFMNNSELEDGEIMNDAEFANGGFMNNSELEDGEIMNDAEFADGGFMNDVYAKGGGIKDKHGFNIYQKLDNKKNKDFWVWEYKSERDVIEDKTDGEIFEDYTEKQIVDYLHSRRERGYNYAFHIQGKKDDDFNFVSQGWQDAWDKYDRDNYANGGMFDDNDGFMKADNNYNYRYPEREVHVDTIDEPIDLTNNVTSRSNKVVIKPLDENIDLSDDNRVRARMTQSNRGSAKDFAKINPRAFEFIEELPMPTSHLHKND